jgi:hypothetical protein
MQNNRRNKSSRTGDKRPRNVNKNRNLSLGAIERAEHPRELSNYEIQQERVLRFTVTAAVIEQTFSFQNLLDAILIATTAIAGTDLFDLVKINKVEVWGQAALGTPSTVSVTFMTTTGDRSIHTDTSLGIKPAHCIGKPSGQSLASFFQASGGGNVFKITAPAGSIIDVSCFFKTANAVPVAAANALVGATAGDLYFRGLDGLAIAGTNFPPIVGVLAI